MSDIVKENATKLLKNNFKYYMAVVAGSNSFIVSSSDSKKDVEKQAKDKLLKLVSNPDDLSGELIYKVNIRKTSKDELKEHKESEIGTIGGILVMTIEEFRCEFRNKKIVFNSLGKITLSDKIYIDNKFLKKNIELKENDIIKLLKKYKNSELGTILSIKKVSKYLSNRKKIEKN